jgi:DNA ligase (NAD+)
MRQLLKKSVDELTDKELSALTIEMNISFRKGFPIVSDDLYDHVYMRALSIRTPDHPLLSGIQPEPEIDSKKLVKHPTRMLSTDKAYTPTKVQSWLNRVIKKGESIGLSPRDIKIESSSKYDGIACRRVAHSKQSVTRGKTGEAGNDISHLEKLGMVIIGDSTKDSLGEIAMKNHHFIKFYSKEALGEAGFTDSRSFIAGMANSNNVNPVALKALKAGHVHLLIYKNMPRESASAENFMDMYEKLEESALKSPYMLDGVIFDIMNPTLQKALGNTSHHPVWRLAKKKIKGIKLVTTYNTRWQVTRTRSIVPVHEIEPTKLNNRVVTSITGHNLGYTQKHGLGIGSRFYAHLGGDVIPSHIETELHIIPTYPRYCPSCEADTEIKNSKQKDGTTNAHLYCSNTSCSGSNSTKIEHTIKELGIDYFGPATVKKLADSGYTSVTKILELNIEDFIKSGFGTGETKKLIKEISRAKSAPIKDSKIISALGINLLGSETSEKLLKQYKIEDLENATYTKIRAIKGFAEITTKATISGLIENKGLLNYILNQNFKIIHTSDIKTSESSISGSTIVFTGTMENNSRDGMKEQAKKLGAIISESVTSKTTMLVIGLKASDNKIKAANGKGITVMSEREYNKLIN